MTDEAKIKAVASAIAAAVRQRGIDYPWSEWMPIAMAAIDAGDAYDAEQRKPPDLANILAAFDEDTP